MKGLAAAGCVACLFGAAACGDSTPSRQPFESSPEWSAQLGGDGFQAPAAIAATDDGVVIGGVYAEELQLGDRRLIGAGGLEGVVAAFDQSGAVRWLHQLTGASGDDSIIALASAPSGDVFVAGQVSAGATFGGSTLAADGGGAALLARVQASGEVAWVVTSRGAGFQAATAVAVAPDGAVYFAGDFSEDLDLGAGPIGTRSEGDAFVARFAPTGELEWVRAIAGVGPQHVEQLAVGPHGDATLVGHYVDELTIESVTEPRNQLTNYTPFVARFRPDGRLAWLQTRLLPPALDHFGHDAAHHAGHADVSVQDLRVAVAPSGAATVGITYGNAFGLASHDFEAALNDNVTVTAIGADGNVTRRSTLRAEGRAGPRRDPGGRRAHGAVPVLGRPAADLGRRRSPGERPAPQPGAHRRHARRIFRADGDVHDPGRGLDQRGRRPTRRRLPRAGGLLARHVHAGPGHLPGAVPLTCAPRSDPVCTSGDSRRRACARC
jgi:hypothetical protein